MRLINFSFMVCILFFINGCSLVKTVEQNITEKRKLREEAELQAELDAQAGAEGVVDIPFVFIPNPYPADDSAVPKAAREDFARVKAQMNAKNWVEAEDLLVRMSETYPNLSGIYVNLGIIYLQLPDYKEAERALIFALELNNTNFDAYTVLGVVYREQGKFAEAEQNYLNALGLWPHHAASQRNIGILYDLYLGKFDKALEHYRISQNLAGGDDRELKLWIVDLERRITEQQSASTETNAPPEETNTPPEENNTSQGVEADAAIAPLTDEDQALRNE